MFIPAQRRIRSGFAKLNARNEVPEEGVCIDDVSRIKGEEKRKEKCYKPETESVHVKMRKRVTDRRDAGRKQHFSEGPSCNDDDRRRRQRPNLGPTAPSLVTSAVGMEGEGRMEERATR